MTMAVNMAYVPKPESGTKVLEMTPDLKRQCRPSSNFRKKMSSINYGKSDSLSEVLIVFRRVAFRGGHWKEKFSKTKYNILQENDHASPQVNC
jgi:hypothetical protein